MGLRFLFVFICVLPLVVEANEFAAQARLFIGSTTVKPTVWNTELTNLGLKDYKDVGHYGVEIMKPIASQLSVGMRYTKRHVGRDEINGDSSTNYESVINQDSILLLARMPLLKKEIFMLDLFGGVGGSNTTLRLRSATQNGELTKRETNDWLASPYFSLGASAAVGMGKFFFFTELGYDSNRVESFKRSEGLTTNVSALDLSGSYVSIGILFDGITATSK